MMHEVDRIAREVLQIFDEIDEKVALMGRETGLHCQVGCGACCRKETVEATVLDFVPLSLRLNREPKELDHWLQLLTQRRKENSQQCIFYSNNSDNRMVGCCSIYSQRPSVCRLFGFAFQRNKYGERQFVSCKTIKSLLPDSGNQIIRFSEAGGELLYFQTYFFKISAIEPGLGFRTMLIDEAFFKALAWVAGHNPFNFEFPVAS